MTKYLSKVQVSSHLTEEYVLYSKYINQFFFESLVWSDLVKLYPSILILLS